MDVRSTGAKRGLALVLAPVLTLAGCGGDDRFDRQRALDDLQADAGLTREQAGCVVDAVEEQFGVSILSERRDPTLDESDAIGAIKTGCVLGEDATATTAG